MTATSKPGSKRTTRAGADKPVGGRRAPRPYAPLVHIKLTAGTARTVDAIASEMQCTHVDVVEAAVEFFRWRMEHDQKQRTGTDPTPIKPKLTLLK